MALTNGIHLLSVTDLSDDNSTVTCHKGFKRSFTSVNDSNSSAFNGGFDLLDRTSIS